MSEMGGHLCSAVPLEDVLSTAGSLKGTPTFPLVWFVSDSWPLVF